MNKCRDCIYFRYEKVTSRQTITRWMDEDQFGNELFTTREAAQAALKERRLHRDR